MSHSREQMRKKAEAQAEAHHHHAHGNVDGSNKSYYDTPNAEGHYPYHPYSDSEVKKMYPGKNVSEVRKKELAGAYGDKNYGRFHDPDPYWRMK